VQSPRSRIWCTVLTSTSEDLSMQTPIKYVSAFVGCAAVIATITFAAEPSATPKQDKYNVKVPGGLAFSEFRGYESWQVVAVSHNERAIAVIVGNPTMIKAYEAGIPANGKAVPDGAKMAKVHWVPKQNQFFPTATVPGDQHDIDFMVKDSKRFGAVGGWGFGAFRYDPASDTFTPATTADNPPQSNDAQCGVACHVIAKKTDGVFTEYGHR
jgi:hypothetical protein